MRTGNVAEKAFAEGVAAEIKNYFPPEYDNMECEVLQQLKDNGVKQTGIRFSMPDQRISPVFYVGSCYQEVQQGKPLEEIMRSIAETVQSAMEQPDPSLGIDFNDYGAVQDFLSFKLINTKANRQMLSELPHKEIEDLSLICILKLPADETDKIGCLSVTYKMAEEWGISGEELYQAAMENVQKKEKPVMQKITDVIMQCIGLEGDNGSRSAEDTDEPAIYVLSNESGVFGAAIMAYPGTMDEISQKFPEGFYILPSSVHEVVILPQGGKMNPKEMGEMVREINKDHVFRSDFLSDRVYEYDKEHQKIRQIPESIEREAAMER